MDGEGEEGGPEETDGGVGRKGGEGADRPPPPLCPQRARLHGCEDQGGEAPGEKYFLRPTVPITPHVNTILQIMLLNPFVMFTI